MTNGNANSSRLLLAILIAVSLGITIYALRQRSEARRLKHETERLEEQIRAQSNAPAVRPDTTTPDVSSPNTQPMPATQPVETAAPAAPPKPQMVLTPTGMAPAPGWTGLTLAGTHVAPVEGGLKTTMQFNPTTTDPLGIVAVVIRLPRDSESRIIGFEASDRESYSDVAEQISPDGKFAVFQGTQSEAKSLEFSLTVSGDAVADVRGTVGIGPFDLRISGTGATVTPKQ